jgi:putative DNA primase/helicase
MTHALAPDPFAPLSSEETTTAAADVVAAGEDLVPIAPVPEDAPAAQFQHRELGEPSTVWDYRDPAGRLLGHVARFDTPDGKHILPRTWCRLPDGSCAWRWRAFSAPRPLYGLDRLAARPSAPVLVVEGEKTTDAAQGHFPDHVAVTWPGGSNAFGKADWSPLAGRKVTVWPDADQAGRRAANEITKLATRAGIALQLSNTTLEYPGVGLRVLLA